ncbi:hypothetical protein SAMN04488112_11837 [Melghirimyces thermohalophilus]|uniref:Uncharacterized protein n=1 Tax=Melghirimyces thermohalophilus TaxID=1236220 RepID=A0A1G6PTH8_9BACL|nr:hypothetical protein SAMN04488112_11837 [Melghirimyces thermohalophilus]
MIVMKRDVRSIPVSSIVIMRNSYWSWSSILCVGCLYTGTFFYFVKSMDDSRWFIDIIVKDFIAKEAGGSHE